ncbi:MAG: peptidoglycan-binding domain-containing protein [Patescibacteria group bacterium]
MRPFFLKRFFLISIVFLSSPFFVFAQDPSVTSYKASATSINSGQLVTFSWTLANAGGYSFVVPCSAGVVVKRENGALLACDTPIASTQVTSDAVILTLYNVSGFTKNITARLTPKTGAGVDYTTASQEISVSVSTVSQPITSFTVPEIDTVRGKPSVVSWTSEIISGVNFQVECNGDIRVSSPNYTVAGELPCGKIIFATDLAASGSLSLSFSNSNLNPVPYTLKLYPAVTPNTSYDGSHAMTLTLNVASDTIPDAYITYFTASTTAINSGDKMTLSWASDRAVGVNMTFSCNQMITATSTQYPDKQFFCNTHMFDPALAPAGQINMSFISTSNEDQIITLTALPSKQAGFYDILRGKSFPLTIRPAVKPVASSSPSLSPTPTPTPFLFPSPTVNPPLMPSGSPLISPKTIFTQFLKRNSRGKEVSALQEFLKRDSGLYPEGLVTGFFGPATERAVQRFQKKYNFVTSGTPATTGYGAVGPKTRSQLNLLQ